MAVKLISNTSFVRNNDNKFEHYNYVWLKDARKRYCDLTGIEMHLILTEFMYDKLVNVLKEFT